MLPANFDAYFAVMGIKRRDWTKPAPQPQKAVVTEMKELEKGRKGERS